MGHSEKPIPIRLDCGHTRYYKKPVPDIGDLVFCVHCGANSEVGLGTLQFGTVYEGDFVVTPVGKSKRFSKRIQGTCLRKDCGETITCNNWHNLQKEMHKHEMNKHTRFGIELVFEDALPPGSEPPF